MNKYAKYYWLDDLLRALTDFLKMAQLHDNTLVLLQSDAGTVATGMLYEQGARILSAARYPPLFGDNGPYVMLRALATAWPKASSRSRARRTPAALMAPTMSSLRAHRVGAR